METACIQQRPFHQDPLETYHLLLQLLVIASVPQQRKAKQSSRFDKLKAPRQSRGWIAAVLFEPLAMTEKVRFVS